MPIARVSSTEVLAKTRVAESVFGLRGVLRIAARACMKRSRLLWRDPSITMGERSKRTTLIGGLDDFGFSFPAKL